jgi:hypothetical protein
MTSIPTGMNLDRMDHDNCFMCEREFVFNRKYVPTAVKANKPICRLCMDQVNVVRQADGYAIHPVHPNAYGLEDQQRGLE